MEEINSQNSQQQTSLSYPSQQQAEKALASIATLLKEAQIFFLF